MAVVVVSATVTRKSFVSSVSATHGERARTDSLVKQANRRGLLSFLLTAPLSIPESNTSKTALLQKYLKKSEENKAKYDKERLENYYKHNYKDYFELFEGSVRAKKGELSETEKGILEWLQTNK